MELVPLCPQRFFVSEVKDRLCVVRVCFIELNWTNKVSVLVVANMEVFFFLAEEIKSLDLIHVEHMLFIVNYHVSCEADSSFLIRHGEHRALFASSLCFWLNGIYWAKNALSFLWVWYQSRWASFAIGLLPCIYESILTWQTLRCSTMDRSYQW